jgi:cysteinyl-tRNA synthetase
MKHEKRKENEEDSGMYSHKPYKVLKYFESALNNEIKKVEEQISIKRKSENDVTSDESEEEEDEDIEELIRKLQESRPKKFFRNADDVSETEESDARVIRLIPQPVAEDIIYDITTTGLDFLSL